MNFSPCGISKLLIRATYHSVGNAAATAILIGGIIYCGFVIAGGEDYIDDHFGYR